MGDYCRPPGERLKAAAKGVGTAALLAFGGAIAGKLIGKFAGKIGGKLAGRGGRPQTTWLI